jgi:hypothetical protein
VQPRSHTPSRQRECRPPLDPIHDYLRVAPASIEWTIDRESADGVGAESHHEFDHVVAVIFDIHELDVEARRQSAVAIAVSHDYFPGAWHKSRNPLEHAVNRQSRAGVVGDPQILDRSVVVVDLRSPERPLAARVIEHIEQGLLRRR